MSVCRVLCVVVVAFALLARAAVAADGAPSSVCESLFVEQELLDEARKLRLLAHYPSARACLWRAIELVPSSAALWTELGYVELEADEPDDAVRFFRMALELDDNEAATALIEQARAAAKGAKRTKVLGHLHTSMPHLVYTRVRETAHGTMLFAPNDLPIGKSLDVYGEWNSGLLSALKASLSPGARVLDIGAGVGTLAIDLARHVGPRGRVYAVEPQRSLHQLLVANTVLNGLTGRIGTEQVAIAEKTMRDAVAMPNPDLLVVQCHSCVITPSEARSDRLVRVVGIDQTPRFTQIGTLDMLIVDVPFKVYGVLMGAMNTIRRFRPVVVFADGWADSNERAEVVHLLNGLGYSTFAHTEPCFKSDNHANETMNVFYTPCSNAFIIARPPASDAGVESKLDVPALDALLKAKSQVLPE